MNQWREKEANLISVQQCIEEGCKKVVEDSRRLVVGLNRLKAENRNWNYAQRKKTRRKSFVATENAIIDGAHRLQMGVVVLVFTRYVASQTIAMILLLGSCFEEQKLPHFRVMRVFIDGKKTS